MAIYIWMSLKIDHHAIIADHAVRTNAQCRLHCDEQPRRYAPSDEGCHDLRSWSARDGDHPVGIPYDGTARITSDVSPGCGRRRRRLEGPAVLSFRDQGRSPAGRDEMGRGAHCGADPSSTRDG